MEKRAARSRAVPEQLFRALADRTRLRLLNLMGEQEICVCYFVEVIGTNQPKISRHLAYLRRAGVVAARRSGKWMHYRIVVPTDARAFILRSTLDWISQDPQMQRDRQRLTRASYAPQSFVRLQAAPLPSPVPKRELMAARDLERNA